MCGRRKAEPVDVIVLRSIVISEQQLLCQSTSTKNLAQTTLLHMSAAVYTLTKNVDLHSYVSRYFLKKGVKYKF